MEQMDSVVTVTRARAAELAGISQRRLGYWEKSGLVRPTSDRAVSSSVRVRLYGYTDLLELLVISVLRERFSLQHIRSIVEHLHTLNWDVSQVAFATDGPKIYFRGPDGVWASGQSPNQFVLSQVLDLQPLRARIGRVRGRREGLEGAVERRRGAFSSKPLIAGTRVPVSTIERFMRSGASDAEILEAFPALVLADLREVRSLQTA